MWNFIQWFLMIIKDVLGKNELSFYTCFKQLISEMYGLWFLWSILIFTIAVGVIYKKTKSLKSMILGGFISMVFDDSFSRQVQPAKNFNIWLFHLLMGFLFCKCRKI